METSQYFLEPLTHFLIWDYTPVKNDPLNFDVTNFICTYPNWSVTKLELRRTYLDNCEIYGSDITNTEFAVGFQSAKKLNKNCKPQNTMLEIVTRNLSDDSSFLNFTYSQPYFRTHIIFTGFITRSTISLP